MGELLYFPILDRARTSVPSKTASLDRIIATYGRLIQLAEARGDAAAVLEYARRRQVDRSSRARRQEIRRHDRAVVRRNEPRWRKEDGAL